MAKQTPLSNTHFLCRFGEIQYNIIIVLFQHRSAWLDP